jgi:hypothetical protein
MTRENKGTGEWSQIDFDDPDEESDPTWPRIATSGENNEILHIFYNSYNEYEGQTSSLLYARSEDGGETWDPEGVIPEGTGSDYYTFISADNYSMAQRGDVIAVLVADSWFDMFMLKSEDNGETWEKTVIWEHPYPFFEFQVTLADTFWAPDGAHDIAIGPDGTAHCVFSISRFRADEEG